MVFSKSFGYAVRGMLYLAMMQNEKPYVQAGEIAAKLGVPRYFIGKILKMLVKEGLLSSSKGPSGGFSIEESAMETPLVTIAELTEGTNFLKQCMLKVKECNPASPCPLHYQFELVKLRLKSVLSETVISDLLNGNREDLIRSIASLQDKGTLLQEHR
jgi:Rrf2 family transcriptional regulator, iron-sulfur cluster assembly transcription factor